MSDLENNRGCVCDTVWILSEVVDIPPTLFSQHRRYQNTCAVFANKPSTSLLRMFIYKHLSSDPIIANQQLETLVNRCYLVIDDFSILSLRKVQLFKG